MALEVDELQRDVRGGGFRAVPRFPHAVAGPLFSGSDASWRVKRGQRGPSPMGGP